MSPAWLRASLSLLLPLSGPFGPRDVHACLPASSLATMAALSHLSLISLLLLTHPQDLLSRRIKRVVHLWPHVPAQVQLPKAPPCTWGAM